MATPPDSESETMRRSSRARAVTTEMSDLMKEDEDWRTIPDSAERRKIQNRIAQRAYRRSMRARKLEIEELKQKLQCMQKSRQGSDTVLLSEVTSLTPTIPPQRGVEVSTVTSSDNTAESTVRGCPRGGDEGVASHFVENCYKSTVRGCPRREDEDVASSSVTAVTQSLSTPLSYAKDKDVLRRASEASSTSRLQSSALQPMPHNGLLGGQPIPPQSVPCTNPLLMSTVPIPENGLSMLDTQADNGEQRWDDFWSWTPVSNSSNGGPNVRLPTPPPHQTVPSLTQNPVCPAPGPRTDVPVLDPNTPLLHMAILSNNLDILKMLLRDDEIFIDEKDAAGFSPLQRAIMLGRSDMVALLLMHGASVLSDRS